jgi:transposase
LKTDKFARGVYVFESVLEGKSYQDIGNEIGLSLSTVKQILVEIEQEVLKLIPYRDRPHDNYGKTSPDRLREFRPLWINYLEIFKNKNNI